MTLPNFLIIGPPKSGTTSLHYALATHPEVFMSTPKEPKYLAFDGPPPTYCGPGDSYVNDRAIDSFVAYEALFASAGSARAIGEASPFYLGSARAPEIIRKHVPAARLVAVLRNPLERAHSQYLHMRRLGREPETSFRRALELEAQRHRDGWEPFWRYAHYGFYGEQLTRYGSEIDRRQLLILTYDDLVDDPESVAASICEFIGVEPRPEAVPRAWWNRSGEVRSQVVRRATRNPNLLRAGRALVPAGPRKRVREWVDRRNLATPAIDSRTWSELAARYRDDLGTASVLAQRDLSGWLRWPPPTARLS